MTPYDGGAGAAARVLTAFPPRIATPDQDMLDHVRSALGRGLPLPRLCRPHNRKLSVAGGGPSLGETWRELDGVIVTANAGLGFLLEKGITPWACGLLDARPHIADLIEPHPDVFYFVASICHPSVFDKLKGCKVVLWHPSGLPGIAEALPPGSDLICGGTTMGLRWLNLGHYMGFRQFAMHGLDSSYRGKQTHAYPDARDGKAGTIEINGYLTDNNFLAQTRDWFQLAEMFALEEDKPTITFHGDGLLQHLVDKRAALVADWPKRPETKPLNIVCLNHGNYLGRGDEYVAKLKAGVEQNYKGRHAFHVLTEDDCPEGLTGWWNKLALFQPGRFEGRCVYFDLDTIVTGSLDDLMAYDGPFAALRDQWQPGQLNSSLMTWTSGELDHVWDRWVAADCPQDDPRGDQAWITEQMPMALRLQDLLPGQLGSWKADFGMNAANIPPTNRVCFFHGQPRPHETPLW